MKVQPKETFVWSTKLTTLLTLCLAVIATTFFWKTTKLENELRAQQHLNHIYHDEETKLKMEIAMLKQKIQEEEASKSEIEKAKSEKAPLIADLLGEKQSLEVEIETLNAKNKKIQSTMKENFYQASSKDAEVHKAAIGKGKLKTQLHKMNAQLDATQKAMEKSIDMLPVNEKKHGEWRDKKEKMKKEFVNTHVKVSKLQLKIKEMEKRDDSFAKGTKEQQKQKLEEKLVRMRSQKVGEKHQKMHEQSIEAVANKLKALQGEMGVEEYMEVVETKITELVKPMKDAISSFLQDNPEVSNALSINNTLINEQ